MLTGAVEMCPDTLWDRPAKGMGFWYQVYHVLFFVDFDLHDASEEFRSPDFDIHEYELKERHPPFESAYSKHVLLDYAGRCGDRVREVLLAVRDGGAVRILGTRRLGLPGLEVVFYEMRHVQHHAAQLNLQLRQEGITPPDWRRRGDEPL